MQQKLLRTPQMIISSILAFYQLRYQSNYNPN